MSALIKIFRLFCMITLVFCTIFAATTALDHLFLYNTPQAVAVSSIEHTTWLPAYFAINIAKIDICSVSFKISNELFGFVSNDLKSSQPIFPSAIVIFLLPGLFLKNAYSRSVKYHAAVFKNKNEFNMARYWS